MIQPPWFSLLCHANTHTVAHVHAALHVKRKQQTQRLQPSPAVRESSLLLANQSYWVVLHHEGMTEPLIRADEQSAAVWRGRVVMLKISSTTKCGTARWWSFGGYSSYLFLLDCNGTKRHHKSLSWRECPPFPIVSLPQDSDLAKLQFHISHSSSLLHSHSTLSLETGLHQN